MTNIKFIDLFCGIGGFHQAIQQLIPTAECVLASDIDKHCQDTYYKNYNVKVNSDIRKIEAKLIPDFDILCAGFPCQAFSNAGKKKTFEDERGTLFDEIIRIVKEKQPKFLFLENVKHIKKVGDGEVFKYILNKLGENNYYLKDGETIFELSPHQLGVPQQRERVIFVAIRKDIYDINKNIIPQIPYSEMDFNSILESEVSEKYKISSEIEKVLETWQKMVDIMDTGQRMSPTILCNEFYKTYSDEEFSNLPTWKKDYIKKNKPIYEKYQDEWDTWHNENKSLLQKKEIYGKLEWQTGKKKENDSIWNYFIQMRQSGIRVKKAVYFPTLVAIVQTPIYAKERRYITPRECARLQSFPDTFILHENDRIAYKQFGNAVNIKVIKTVMKSVFDMYLDN
jgi:DNA (cytosine-5)-methyltransferase 1